MTWFVPFSRSISGSFINGDINCFSGGRINASYNCIDRHIATRSEQTAIIWESDEVGVCRHITYAELASEVCRIANAMKCLGVRKGDVITLYMPMMPELAMIMLACARIGAVHSVVFAGFSADSLRDRIIDCGSHFVFTADEGKRGGKTLKLKEIVDAVSLREASSVLLFHVFISVYVRLFDMSPLYKRLLCLREPVLPFI